jgi:hypothetical protein
LLTAIIIGSHIIDPGEMMREKKMKMEKEKGAGLSTLDVQVPKTMFFRNIKLVSTMPK